jgi:predicted RNA-binding protein with PIN domain
MIIIIDGYNFLKSITGTKFISDVQMHQWISYFQKYLSFRGNQIVIVFDAGPSFFESHDKHGSVEVWYAGQYQTADDWIKKWLTKNRHKDILLVSSDREIRDWADSLSVVSLSSQEFYQILHNVVQEEELEQKVQMQSLHKTKEDEAVDTYLDNLMEMGSRSIVSVYKENEYTQGVERTPKHKKNSRTDRVVLKKINKI